MAWLPWRLDLVRDGVVLLRGHYPADLIRSALSRAHEVRETGAAKVRSGQVVDSLDLLVTPTIRRLARRYLGHAPEHHSASLVRFQRPETKRLPFHQDQALLIAPLLNLWIALTPAGKKSPGLEVVRGSHRSLLPTIGDPNAARTVDRAYIPDEAVSGVRLTPFMRPGDALLFTGATIHRTHSTQAMTAERVSIEHRLI